MTKLLWIVLLVSYLAACNGSQQVEEVSAAQIRRPIHQITRYGNIGQPMVQFCSPIFTSKESAYFQKGPEGQERLVIGDGSRVRLHDTGVLVAMWVNSLEMADAGRYVCGDQEIMLFVHGEPTINGYDSNATVRAELNNTVSLVCQWSGKRNPDSGYNLEWEHGNLNDVYVGRLKVRLTRDGMIHLSLAMDVEATAETNGTEFQCNLVLRTNVEYVFDIDKLYTNIRLEVFEEEEDQDHSMHLKMLEPFLILIGLIFLVAIIGHFVRKCLHKSINISVTDSTFPVALYDPAKMISLRMNSQSYASPLVGSHDDLNDCN